MIRGITSFALALIALSTATAALAQGQAVPHAREPVVVIELFTSQSCPVCPDADEFVAELNQRPDIFVLSWPVDIWDYLGWEDTLAAPENTRRQAIYNGHFGMRWPYTPEIVIDGRMHIAGNQREEVLQQIEMIRDDSFVRVPLRMRFSEERLTINVGESPNEIGGEMGTIWLVPYRRHVEVDVGGGPNDGRSLSYTNVALGYEPISQWAGRHLLVRHPLSLDPSEGPDGYVVLLQKNRNGPIIGAARLQVRWDGANAD